MQRIFFTQIRSSMLMDWIYFDPIRFFTFARRFFHLSGKCFTFYFLIKTFTHLARIVASENQEYCTLLLFDKDIYGYSQFSIFFVHFTCSGNSLKLHQICKFHIYIHINQIYQSAGEKEMERWRERKKEERTKNNVQNKVSFASLLPFSAVLYSFVHSFFIHINFGVTLRCTTYSYMLLCDCTMYTFMRMRTNTIPET